jgi:hypothetical protein
MAKFSIHPWAKVGSLKNVTVMDLTAELSNMRIENDLRREVQEDIRRLRDMGTYRGRRHAMGLPVRGQRTRTQVGDGAQSECDGMLTVADHNGATIEQGRKRWFRQGTAIRRATSIIVSYCIIVHVHLTAITTRHLDHGTLMCYHFVQRHTIFHTGFLLVPSARE